MDFQTVYEGEIWCLCTVTFGQKSSKLNSRTVYCSQLYGTYPLQGKVHVWILAYSNPASLSIPSMLYDFVPFLLSKILCSQYFAEVKQEIWGRKFLPPLLKFFFTQHTIIMHCTVENNWNLKPKIPNYRKVASTNASRLVTLPYISLILDPAPSVGTY